MTSFDISSFAILEFRAFFDPPFERLNARDVGQAEILAINPRFQTSEKLIAQLTVTGNRACFDERLPLPRAALYVVVRQRAVEAHAEWRPRAFRPKSQIDTIGRAKIGRLGEQANDLLREPLEVLLVADSAASVGLAILFA